MSSFEFLLPTRIVFGNDVIDQIGAEAKKIGSRALIITDKGVLKTGYIERIQQLLKDAGVESAVFSDVDPNPRDTSVQKGFTIATKFETDLLVGVGGGSAIDTAKAIGVILQEGGQIQDYEGLDRVQKPITPLIAVPTTAGTGTEVTFWSVITDTKRKFKMSIGSPLMAARVALVDPMLTLTLPKDVTAYTGIDALVHAIEGYTSMLSQPGFRFGSRFPPLSALITISVKPMQTVAMWDARHNMMLGSMLAGISFGNSDVASVHCMGEAMGGLYDTPHGLSMAVCLPYCMEYNIISNPEKFSAIAWALGEDVEGLTSLEAARQGVDAIRRLLKDLNIPDARSVGLKMADLNKLATAAAVNVSVESNPRNLDKQDFLILFQRAYDNASA